MAADALATGLTNFVLFALLVGFRRLVNRETWQSFGLHLDRRGAGLLGGGLVAGALGIFLYGFAAVSAGLGKFVFTPSQGKETLLLFLTGGFGFLGVALFEEALFRGYLLPKLAKVLPGAAAVLLTSVLFGLIHYPGYQASLHPWIGTSNAALIGVLLCVLVFRTRSLMAAVGFHLGWNLAQEVLTSGERSGIHALVNLVVQTGLPAGDARVPESGLLVTLVIGIFLAAALIIPQSRPAAQDQALNISKVISNNLEI